MAPLKILPSRKPTYARFVASKWPNKAKHFCVRLTCGGNLVHYPGNVSIPTAALTTAKIVLNSTISRPRSRFMAINVKKFYLGTNMDRYKYMLIAIHLIPAKIIDQYNLNNIAKNGYVLVEIWKGMYGLPQAGKLAHNQLVKHLATFGYHPVKHTAGLWRRTTRDIVFCLVVNDFGVRYNKEQDVKHLISALTTRYKITTDWNGSNTLAWT